MSDGAAAEGGRWAGRPAAALLVAAALAVPARGAALEPASVQLKWRHHFQFAGYYVALERGYYREAGLDVTIREGGPAVEVEAEVAEGRADFGVGTSAVVLEQARGRDLVVLAQVFQHSAAVILAPRRAGIGAVPQLAGRRVMYSNQHGDILALLKRHGLDERSFEAVAHAGDPQDLLDGKADAMVAYRFNEPFVLERAGEPYVVFSPLASGIDFYGDNLFTTRGLAEARPAFVAAFREATLRGWRHALEHKEEAADLILARYSQARSREWLLFEAAQVEALVQPDLVELGYQSASRWGRIGSVFADLGMLPRDHDAAKVAWSAPSRADYRLLVWTVLSAGGAIAVLTGVVLVFRAVNRRLQAEVAERRASERSLRESEARLQATMDAMPVAIAVLEGERIAYLNERFTALFGYRRADLPDLEVWYGHAYPDPTYRRERSNGWRAAVAEARVTGGPVRPVEARVRCQGGADRLVLINAQPLHEQVLVIFTDLTDRERHQVELLKLQKLESVGVLAGGIAHDFNNLLTGILGNVSLARSLLPPDGEACRALGEAEHASGRAGELALQLLTFARGAEPVKRAVSVRALVASTGSLVLRGSKAELRLDVPDGLRDVEADEGQLGQALTNVLLNAVQAMPDGGLVTVMAADVTVRGGGPLPVSPGLAPGPYVRISIADTGAGIRAEHLGLVFDPYFTTKATGSGLGLASVHSIVRRHGGAVTVRSAPGQGTTFELWLPASAAAAEPPSTPAPTLVHPEAARRPILVMDDELAIRQVARRILERLGHPVVTCDTGEEALERYREARAAGRPFAAVIMDLTIRGGMGGAEAAQRLLAEDPDARLVVSSGYSTDPVLSDHARHGFRAVLGKPYQVSEVAAVLGRLLG